MMDKIQAAFLGIFINVKSNAACYRQIEGVMDKKELKIKRLEPIVEKIWGLFLVSISCVLIIEGV